MLEDIYIENINDKDEKENESLENSIKDNLTLTFNSQTMARHSDAATEYIKAYTGKNYQANGALKDEMKKSLQSISHEKINPNDAERNLKQHAGFSAEVMDVAERNAEEKLKGSNIRYSRADDVKGHKINETKNDIVVLDADGNELLGPDGQVQGTQMKFIKMGKSAEETATQLVSSKFRTKYPDGEFCVAKDKYEGVQEALKNKEVQLQSQIERAKQNGNTEVAAKKQEELAYVKKVRNNMQQSKVTEEEAMIATQRPMEWTVGKVADMSHRAGVECAKSAAAITFVSSFAKNLSGYLKGDMDEETALKNLAKDTIKGTAGAYVVGYANTAIASTLQTSSNEIIRNFVTQYPNSPAYVISFLAQSFTIIGKRMNGEITDEQCFKEIGKTALVMGGSIGGKVVGTSVGTALGQAIGGTVGVALGPVGAIVGSFIGSVVVSTAVDVIGKEIDGIIRADALLKNQQHRLEEVKVRYENLCKELDEYDRVFKETYIAHTEELRAIFGNSIIGMAYALQIKDADSFIVHTNNITHSLGKKTQFNNVHEFKSMVKNRVPLEL